MVAATAIHSKIKFNTHEVRTVEASPVSEPLDRCIRNSVSIALHVDVTTDSGVSVVWLRTDV
jgi:hypothetical protein